VESVAAAARWSEPGEWQSFQMELAASGTDPGMAHNTPKLLQHGDRARRAGLNPFRGTSSLLHLCPSVLISHAAFCAVGIHLRAHTGKLISRPSQISEDMSGSVVTPIEASTLSGSEAQVFEIVIG
jgi:hypothetical protein